MISDTRSIRLPLTSDEKDLFPATLCPYIIKRVSFYGLNAEMFIFSGIEYSMVMRSEQIRSP